jgi:chromosome partitioning protein
LYDDPTTLVQLGARDGGHFNMAMVKNPNLPPTVRVAAAPPHGLPAVIYDAKSRGAAAYVALAQEMLGRQAAA